MAGDKTTRVSRRGALLCFLLAVSLCAPLLSAGISAEPDQSVQILALAGPATGILMNQRGPRVDHARHRTAVHSPFLFFPSYRRAGRGRLARAVEDSRLHSRCDARTHSGRSPPGAIS